MYSAAPTIKADGIEWEKEESLVRMCLHLCKKKLCMDNLHTYYWEFTTFCNNLKVSFHYLILN